MAQRLLACMRLVSRIYSLRLSFLINILHNLYVLNTLRITMKIHILPPLHAIISERKEKKRKETSISELTLIMSIGEVGNHTRKTPEMHCEGFCSHLPYHLISLSAERWLPIQGVGFWRCFVIGLPDLNRLVRLSANKTEASPIKSCRHDARFSFERTRLGSGV